MTESSPTESGPAAGSEPDAIRADIEKTRAELADTVDALSSKLDVKGRAADKVTETKAEVRAKVSDTVSSVKAAAPEPVQRALGKTAETVGPVAHRAAQQASPYRKQIALGAFAGAMALLIFRRRRAAAARPARRKSSGRSR